MFHQEPTARNQLLLVADRLVSVGQDFKKAWDFFNLLIILVKEILCNNTSGVIILQKLHGKMTCRYLSGRLYRKIERINTDKPPEPNVSMNIKDVQNSEKLK